MEVRSVKRVKMRRTFASHIYVNYCFLRKAVNITLVTTMSYVTGKSSYKRQLRQSFFNGNEFSSTEAKSLLANNVYR